MAFREVKSVTDKQHFVLRLLPRHYKIIDLTLEGLDCSQIAEKLEMSRQQVTNVSNSPTFQHELALRRSSIESQHDEVVVQETIANISEVKKFIEDKAMFAAQAIAREVMNPDAKVRLASAMDLLDRAGIAKITKAEQVSRSVVVNLTSSDLDRLKQTFDLDKDTD
jgi:hypothetical protein